MSSDSRPDPIEAAITASAKQLEQELATVRATMAEPPKHTNEFRKTISMWTRPFTRFHQIPVFKRVWLYLAAVTVYTIAIDVLATTSLPTKLFKEAGAAGAFGGIVMGLLLVFRTNTAYDRWWEARKLWGQLTNDSRNLALKVRALVPAHPLQKERFGELIISFAFALKHHLRNTTPDEPLPSVGELSVSEAKHLPLHISKLIYDTVSAWEKEGNIRGVTLLVVDQHTRALMDICGACERIKSSPLAVSYRAFMRQGIALNLLAMPWYMVQEFGLWWSLPPMLICAYFLIGIELIAEDIEEPFGKDGDDLPLDDICQNIKATVSSILEVQEDQKFTRTFQKPRIDVLKDTGHWSK